MSGTSSEPANKPKTSRPTSRSTSTSVENAVMSAWMLRRRMSGAPRRACIEGAAGGHDAGGGRGVVRRIHEHGVGLHGEHGDLAGTRRHVAVRETHRMLPHETCRGDHGAMFAPRGFVFVIEMPARDALVDHGFPVTRVHAGGAEDAAIVGAAGVWTMRIDGTATAVEHRAMTLGVRGHEAGSIGLG